jgi:hypothetical protein
MKNRQNYVLWCGLYFLAAYALSSSIGTTMALAYAQQPDDRLTYEDPIFGMKIDYPANWERTDSKNGVEFRPPDAEEALTAFNLRTEIPPAEAPLKDLLRALVNEYRTLPNFSIVNTTSTTILGGLPGEKAVYTHTNLGEFDFCESIEGFPSSDLDVLCDEPSNGLVLL